MIHVSTKPNKQLIPKSHVFALTMHKMIIQSTVGKQMVTVHFTTISYKPLSTKKALFLQYFPCSREIVHAGFEDVRTNLYVSVSITRLLCAKNYW